MGFITFALNDARSRADEDLILKTIVVTRPEDSQDNEDQNPLTRHRLRF